MTQVSQQPTLPGLTSMGCILAPFCMTGYNSNGLYIFFMFYSYFLSKEIDVGIVRCPGQKLWELWGVQDTCPRRWWRTEFEKDLFISYFDHLCSCCSRHCEQWVAELQLKEFESLFQLYFCSFLYISSFCFHCPHLFPANANFVYAPPDSNYWIKMLYIRENIIYWTWFKYACGLSWTANITQTTADFFRGSCGCWWGCKSQINNHSSILTPSPWKLALHPFFPDDCTLNRLCWKVFHSHWLRQSLPLPLSKSPFMIQNKHFV